jgi:glycerophosphoryl diester phosphodiesterase
MKLAIYIFSFIVFCISCETSLDSPVLPNAQIEEFKRSGEELNSYKLKVLDGIYVTSGDKAKFGNKVAIKANRHSVSIFCETQGLFMVLEPRLVYNKIQLGGYWRKAQGGESGFVKIEIDSMQSANILMNKSLDSISLSGLYDKNKFELTYSKALKNGEFIIIGHRGGGRNSDRHPASENSIEMIKYSEQLGANGVEIDVQNTHDRIPVLFHDTYMSKRLIREDCFIGKISDYTYKQIRAFCTLKNGEKIPTLRESLDFIIDSSDHKFVWLDVKNAGDLKEIIDIQKEYIAKAKNANRKIEILIGAPSEESRNELLKYDYASIPSICELEESEVYKLKSKAWAPRWSLGLLSDRVNAVHAQGLKAYVWTLDEPQFIRKYLKLSAFDGILTNYPSIVAYEYYSQD